MAQADATEQQLARLDTIRKQFGKQAVKTYRVEPRTGVMTVTLTAQTGTWFWEFTRRGNMIGRWFQQHITELDTANVQAVTRDEADLVDKIVTGHHTTTPSP